MMFVFIGSWWRLLRLVVLVFGWCLELHGGVLLFAVGCLLLCDCYVWSYWFSKECLELHGGVLLFVVGCLLFCDRYVWSYWFSKNVLNFAGGVLLFIVGCLLLVTSVLVFEECLELHGGVLLVVGCLLLGKRYVWSYWFLTLLVVHAFCTASGCGFLAVNWAVGVI